MTELLLKASFAIGIAVLFYKLLLQQESFFMANRLYLLGCIALAFALPYVSLPQLVNQQGFLATVFQQNNTALQHRIPAVESEITEDVVGPAKTQRSEMTQQSITQPRQQAKSAGVPAKANAAPADSNAFTWMFWLTVLYLFGVAVFTLSLLFQLGSILYKIRTATDKIRDGDCVIVNTASRQAPCSFFRYIFIYPDEYDFETYEQIIAHEKIHARLGHSFDLLLAEIAVIILWFNPLAWLLKREIEKNNEYQTDAELLEKVRVSRDQYQLNLVQIAVPNKPLSIVTNYNQSLLKQRIMMMNAKRSTPHAYWKYMFLVPVLFGMLLLLNEPAISQGNPTANSLQVPVPAPDVRTNPKSATIIKENLQEKTAEKVKESITGKPKTGKQSRNSLNMQGEDVDMSQGYWYSSQENGQYCIEFKGSKKASNWNMSRCFDKRQFQKNDNNTFVITKETGTLQLTGNLDAEVGQGKYTFTEDASFREYLASNNITSDNKNLLFHLFFGDVNKAYVAYLKKQYGEVEGKRLMELAIFDITREDFQKYVAMFEKHGNKKPTMEEVVAARIHGIDEAFVQEMEAAGYKNQPMEELMAAKIQGVNREYIEDLRKAGFTGLPLNKVVAAKIHGITAASVKELQGLGFGKLSLDEFMQMRIQGVNAAYVADLRSAGFADLSSEQVVQAKIFGLNAKTVKEINALGFKNLDFEDMINARIHGVDAAYVQELRKAGFPDLSMEEAVAAKIHGINSAFIKKAKQDGYNLSSIDKYIALKIHGMALESLKEKEKEKEKGKEKVK